MDVIKKGLVIKSYCGYYQVSADQNYTCKPRKKLSEIMVGDKVEFTLTSPNEGIIESIDPRKLHISKPPVANISQIVLVFSFAEPELDSETMDNFLLLAEQEQISVIVCVNKSDKMDNNKREDLRYYEDLGYKVFCTSIYSPDTIAKLSKELSGNISVLIGPSGVGKTSILNKLKVGLNLKTGAVSAGNERGKNTTRFVELIEVDESAWVVDTPGFSFIRHELSSAQLADCFPEFRLLAGECRFANCVHLNEPDCKIRENVDNGHIRKSRYVSYTNAMRKLVEQERNKYR